MKLNEREKQIILSYAENNMNELETARKLYRDRSGIEYHFRKIEQETGLNPKRFYDLVKLVEMCHETRYEWD